MIIPIKGVRVLTLLLPIFFSASTVLAGQYLHSVNVADMTFSWSIEGETLKGQVSAPTEGWVAVGFNATNRMQHANIIIGSVDQGEVIISDEYGQSPFSHGADSKLGGTSDVEVIGGSEENGITSIEFSMPLDSGDAETDGKIDPSRETVVILAYGKQDSFRVSHGKNRYRVTLNLSSGQSS